MNAGSVIMGAARIMQILAIGILGVASAGLVGSAIAAALGVIPWLTLPLTFGDTQVAEAGTYLQIGLGILTASLLFMIPSNKRILALEHSHRDFQIGMDDVARAYYVCHAADRAGTFTLSAEFDSVRERLHFLRNHPDLGQLEAGVLEVAAQMSQQSRELSDIYSDENVARARDFLRQRQTEVETQRQKISDAMKACKEITDWSEQIAQDESAIDAELRALDDTVRTALPPLGYDIVRTGPQSRQQIYAVGAQLPAE